MNAGFHFHLYSAPDLRILLLFLLRLIVVLLDSLLRAIDDITIVDAYFRSNLLRWSGYKKGQGTEVATAVSIVSNL